MTNVISENVFAAIQSFSDSARKAYGKKTKAIDEMVAVGFIPELFYAPKENGGQLFTFTDGTSFSRLEIFNDIKAAVVAGFTVKERELLSTPTKALPQCKKDEKGDLQRRIGSVTRDLRVALDKRLDLPKAEKVKAEKVKAEKVETETETEAANDTGAKVRIAEKLIAAMKIAQKDEKPDYEILKLVKAITAAMAALGEEFPQEEEFPKE